MSADDDSATEVIETNVEQLKKLSSIDVYR